MIMTSMTDTNVAIKERKKLETEGVNVLTEVLRVGQYAKFKSEVIVFS